MKTQGNVRSLAAPLGDYDPTRQTARAMIELIKPVTRTHVSVLSSRKSNQFL
jgi:hypothetical protein